MREQDWDDEVDQDWGEETAPGPEKRGLLRRIGQAGAQRRGNVKRAEASDARRRAVREAQGQAQQEPDGWRMQLASGDRDGAAATLASRRLTHNAGRGFGLAEQQSRKQ